MHSIISITWKTRSASKKERNNLCSGTDLNDLWKWGLILSFSPFPIIPCSLATSITPDYRENEREQERGRFATNQTNWPLCACEVQLCVVRPGTLQAFVWLLWLLWALPLGKRRVMGLGVFSDYIGALLGYLFIYSRGSGGTENNFPLVFRRLSHIIV